MEGEGTREAPWGHTGVFQQKGGDGGWGRGEQGPEASWLGTSCHGVWLWCGTGGTRRQDRLEMALVPTRGGRLRGLAFLAKEFECSL